MKRIAAVTRALVLIGWVGGGAQSATLYIQEEVTSARSSVYRLTGVDADPSEFKKETQTGAPGEVYLGYFVGATYMGCGSVIPKRCAPRLDPRPRECNDGYDALEALRSMIGQGVVVEPCSYCRLSAEFSCHGRAPGFITRLRGVWVVKRPPTATCSGSAGQLTLMGTVGARATATTDVYISCDWETSLRVSLPDSGVVKVGGGGEVQLKFPAGVGSSLTVTGTNPVVRIDGELTKSPTTAGTYRGSTVLRIDVL